MGRGELRVIEPSGFLVTAVFDCDWFAGRSGLIGVVGLCGLFCDCKGCSHQGCVLLISTGLQAVRVSRRVMGRARRRCVEIGGNLWAMLGDGIPVGGMGRCCARE